jgi:hypothetical protein
VGRREPECPAAAGEPGRLGCRKREQYRDSGDRERAGERRVEGDRRADDDGVGAVDLDRPPQLHEQTRLAAGEIDERHAQALFAQLVLIEPELHRVPLRHAARRARAGEIEQHRHERHAGLPCGRGRRRDRRRCGRAPREADREKDREAAHRC